MVLESLINPASVKRKPVHFILLGFLYATIALFLAIWVFKSQAGLIAVFLTVMAALPFIFMSIKLEAAKTETIFRERTLFKEHAKTLSLFVYLFIGRRFFTH